MHAVNIFKGTDSSVIGPKFPGSLGGPFLCISYLADFFHSSGIIPVFHIIDNSEATNDLKYEHLLKQMMEI